MLRRAFFCVPIAGPGEGSLHDYDDVHVDMYDSAETAAVKFLRSETRRLLANAGMCFQVQKTFVDKPEFSL